MRIEAINIHNFKAIKSYKGEIGGKNVYLIGGNATGKTSFIDAVFTGLTGKRLPPEPINNGGKKGVIEIDLGEFIARTKFSKGRPAVFELENKNYEGDADKFIKSPRSYMERRVGILDFDINDFLAMSDAKQVEYVAKYLAVDFSDLDTEIEELYESRKFDKKKLAELKLRQDYYDEELAKKELVSVAEVSRQIEAEKEKKANYDKVVEGMKERQNRMSEIKNEIAQLEKESERLYSELVDGKKWITDESNQAMSDEKIEELVKTRDDAESINSKIKEAKDAKEVDEKIEAIEADIETYNEDIENRKESKAARISKAIKMDDLTYSVDEEKFLYQGRPFDKTQTNTAAQLITGMKIASMMLKDLKILRVDASLIDKVEFDKVLEWATANGIELFVELVDREAAQLSINVLDE